MYQRILICTDGSPLSDKAVKSGISLAAGLDAEIVAFTVVDFYPQTYFEGAIALTAKEVQAIEKQWRDKAQAVLDDVQKQAHTRDVKTTTVVGQGLVSDAIIKAAKKHKCDLIVMASHGRKGVARVLLGSETLAVLTHSTLPVLVLR
jgi:nucleotide-binding universal stress UspA family protein